jgi:hypothetical protein
VCENNHSDKPAAVHLRCGTMKRKRRRKQQQAAQVIRFTDEEEAFFREGDSSESLEVLHVEYERPLNWLRRLFLRAVA